MTTTHCEWGEWGVQSLLPVADVFIIVDVLSFSTCVEIAVSRGATVWPYPWKDGSARQFARDKGALLAGKRGDRYSLSPASLRNLPAGSQLVLPSPNGAALSLTSARTSASGGSLVGMSRRLVRCTATQRATRRVAPTNNKSNCDVPSRTTLCGCLRNASAVAKVALNLASVGAASRPRPAGMTPVIAAGRRSHKRSSIATGHIAVIPAGERWPDDSLRPCFEDWIGAGAIIEHLPGGRSPEAEAALAAWRSAQPRLPALLRDCLSGRELIERGFPQDVEVAGEVNVSSSVPILCDGVFRRQA